VPLLAAVEEAATVYHEAAVALEAARADLYATIIEATSEGIPGAVVGRSAGLSRERIRQIVESYDPADQPGPTNS
jgi:hypothetical protein